MKIYFNSKKNKNHKIKLGFFTRRGGLSLGKFSSMNCSLNSEDEENIVSKNIDIALSNLNLNNKFLKTVKQIHSNKVEIIDKNNLNKNIEADGMITQDHKISLGILTADCCPVFLFDVNASFISCIHVGWKGAYKNIIKSALNKIIKIQPDYNKINAILGPCLGKENFEVDHDFKKKFILLNENYNKYFKDCSKYNKFLFDLGSIIKSQLLNLNITNIEEIDKDTYSNKKLFFSHRRSTHLQNLPTGRMINIIGFNN